MDVYQVKSAKNGIQRLLILAAVVSVQLLLTYPVYSKPTTWNEDSLTHDELLHKYGGESDEISIYDARNQMLDLVNRDRYDLEREDILKLDELACAVAQAHAEEMANYRYLGHYNLSGWKAPERFNAAGGTDMVIENVSYWEVENFDAYITPQMVQDFEARWLKSPGHYRAIMTPEATSMGFGISLSRQGKISVLAAVQLFVVDRSDFRLITGRIKRIKGKPLKIEISGRLHSSVEFFYAAVGAEPLPTSRTAEWLNSHLSPYDTPEPFAGYLEQVAEGRQRLKGLTTYYTFSVGTDNRAINGVVLLDDGKESSGLYYVYIFVRDKDGYVYPVMLQTVEVV